MPGIVVPTKPPDDQKQASQPVNKTYPMRPFQFISSVLKASNGISDKSSLPMFPSPTVRVSRHGVDVRAEDAQAFNHVGREKIREYFSGIEAVDDNVDVLLCSNLSIDVDGELSTARSISRWSWECRRVEGK